MLSPAASTFLVESVLVGALSSEPIGSDAFTVSKPTAVSGKSLVRTESQAPAATDSQRSKVRVYELLEAFKACLVNDLVWIEDFCDDEVEISRDLHEVLEAFAQIRRQDVGEN